MFILEQARGAFPIVWARIDTFDTVEDALKQVRGDAQHAITNSETGEMRIVRSRYGGGLEMTSDNGKTWQRIKRPGAMSGDTKPGDLGIRSRPLQRGWYTRPVDDRDDMTMPAMDAIERMARRGAAINAANGK